MKIRIKLMDTKKLTFNWFITQKLIKEGLMDIQVLLLKS